MILVADLVSSTSFCYKRKAKNFKNCSRDHVFSCVVKICWPNTFLNLSEATIRVFLKISQISQEKACVVESLFNKSEGLQLYLKETPTQVFSCKICDIFKNAYFEEHLQTASFKLNLIFKTSTAYSVYCLLDGHCSSLCSLIHVINFFLMTSFAYIFLCPFTLLHLLPTVINLFYYEYWTDKQKYFYVKGSLFKPH